jgi:glucose/arabinose dehydrogenase
MALATRMKVSSMGVNDRPQRRESSRVHVRHIGGPTRVAGATPWRWRAAALTLLLAVALASCGGPFAGSARSSDPTQTPYGLQQPDLAGIQVPAGFRITTYATGLRAPRFLTFGADGTLFVAESGSGAVVALSDPGHTGAAATRTTVLDHLNYPTSVEVSMGALYVGERSEIVRVPIGPDLRATGKQVIVPDLPTAGNHITRTVHLGPGGKLYVAIGSTCDACVEADPRRAAIWVYNADGSGGRLFARGLRNAVGLANNSWNGQMWATDMGRDYLGEDSPPDTIYALRDGADYGWPRCHAGDILDPALGQPGDCNGIEQPLVKLPAHSSPLGLAFYRTGAFPAAWHGLFVAYHGSWNRMVPTGYKIVFIPLNAQGAVAGPPQDFATGWLHADGTVTGRPVGLAIGPDGALYVSDDQAGAVYRIVYSG